MLEGQFIEFILGLSYPDDSVKSAVVCILVQICSISQRNTLAMPLVQKMCNYISTNLANAKSQELTINLLGEYEIGIIYEKISIHIGSFSVLCSGYIRECGSTLYVGLARTAPPTNTNFRLTFFTNPTPGGSL